MQLDMRQAQAALGWLTALARDGERRGLRRFQAGVLPAADRWRRRSEEPSEPTVQAGRL